MKNELAAFTAAIDEMRSFIASIRPRPATHVCGLYVGPDCDEIREGIVEALRWRWDGDGWEWTLPRNDRLISVDVQPGAHVEAGWEWRHVEVDEPDGGMVARVTFAVERMSDAEQEEFGRGGCDGCERVWFLVEAS